MADDKKIIKVDKQKTRAKADVSTFNRENRTIEVTFATETPVRAFDWETVGGYFKEILSCDPSHVNLVRLKSGAPVLDNHDKYSSVKKAIVGVVEDAWIVGNECRARLRFSKSPENELLMEEVADGIVQNISVGYDVFAYQVIRTAVDGELDTYKAVNWEPTEISFTTVPADYNSKVRSEVEGGHEVTIEEVAAAPADTQEVPEADPPANTEDTPAEPVENNEDPNQENNTNSNNNNEMTEEEKKAANLAARSAERTRIAGIRGHVRTLNLPDEFADTLIDDDEVTVEVAAVRALKEWEKSNPFNGRQQAGQQQTDADKTRNAMTNAIVLRVSPSAAAVIGDDNVRAAADFKGMNLLRLAEESLILQGVRTKGMSGREIAKAALGVGKVRGMHHTTDFPALLGDVVQRTLLAMYQLQERTFMPFCRRATLSDFRQVTRQKISELLGSLEKVEEGGEYKSTTFKTKGESYKLAKYGRKIAITWESIINDDLGVFDRIPQAFAAMAAQLQNDMVYDILVSNPKMSDGKALFHADHKNLGVAAVLGEAALTLAEQSFLTMKDDADKFIRVNPKFLVVGPKNKVVAQKLTSTAFVPATQQNVALSQFTGLIPIVDPSITDYAWHLIADPAMIDTIEYAFLDGEEELFMDQREGFDVDGVEIKARLVFACKAIDYKGMYKNPGLAPA